MQQVAPHAGRQPPATIPTRQLHAMEFIADSLDRIDGHLERIAASLAGSSPHKPIGEARRTVARVGRCRRALGTTHLILSHSAAATWCPQSTVCSSGIFRADARLRAAGRIACSRRRSDRGSSDVSLLPHFPFGSQPATNQRWVESGRGTGSSRIVGRAHQRCAEAGVHSKGSAPRRWLTTKA